MDAHSFRATLEADGFCEVEDKEVAAGTANDDHGHSWDVRLLVLEGSLTLGREGTSRTYRAGEVLELARDIAHTEHYDKSGPTRLIVGRRH